MTPKMRKLAKISNFLRFNAILSVFRWISLIKMLKRFNKARVRCRVVVYEEIIAVFLERKGPKNDKTPKISQFLTFLCNFSQIFNKRRGLEC